MFSLFERLEKRKHILQEIEKEYVLNRIKEIEAEKIYKPNKYDCNKEQLQEDYNALDYVFRDPMKISVNNPNYVICFDEDNYITCVYEVE